MGVINILIAGDNPIKRLGIRTLLESEPSFKVVGEASNGLEAVQMVKRLSPDVVVLDLMMPFLNGIEAARQVRAQFPHIRIVILFGFESEVNKIEATNTGADAYLLKRSPIEELVGTIHEILDTRCYLFKTLNEKAVNSNVQDLHIIDTIESNLLMTLTPREREILIFIARGYTNSEISHKLTISERTVETHRANVMHKLGAKSHIHLVRFAIEHGLIPIE